MHLQLPVFDKRVTPNVTIKSFALGFPLYAQSVAAMCQFIGIWDRPLSPLEQLVPKHDSRADTFAFPLSDLPMPVRTRRTFLEMGVPSDVAVRALNGDQVGGSYGYPS
jgi:hypothetical protein